MRTRNNKSVIEGVTGRIVAFKRSLPEYTSNNGVKSPRNIPKMTPILPDTKSIKKNIA